MPRRFDHCVLCVHDLDRAAVAFEALGFVLTPVAQLPFGVRNRLALFGDSYLELLAVDDPAAIATSAPGQFSFGAHNQAFLAGGEGMSMLAWHSTDARADAQYFKDSGCGAYAPVDFGRDASMRSGEVLRFSFSLAFATDAAMPQLAFFCCQQHHAPDRFWRRPQYQLHPNGARGIVEIVMTAAEPERHRRFLEQVSDGTAEPVTGGFGIATAGGRLTMLEPEEAARRFGESLTAGEPRFCAVRLAIANITDARLVPASDACGVALEFIGERMDARANPV